MALKDLSAFFTPALELPWGGKTYVVQPPDKDTGLKLAAINAVGIATYAATLESCPACGRGGAPNVPAETMALFESLKNADVAALSLGQDVYDEMIADNVPGPHIDTFGIYALYFWVLGEATADQIMAAQAGGEVGEAPSIPQLGRPTGSANPTP